MLLTRPKFVFPTVAVAAAAVVAMVEAGTLTTLPYCWLSTVARYPLLVLELSTGAWPGVNQEAGRREFGSIRASAVASPYQVLRVANCSAGMLNLGM